MLIQLFSRLGLFCPASGKKKIRSDPFKTVQKKLDF